MGRRTALLLAGSLALVGCTSDPGPAEPESATPSGSPATTANPSADPSPEGEEQSGVVLETMHLDVPILVEVLPIQTTGDEALVTVEYSLAPEAPEDARLNLTLLLEIVGGSDPLGAVDVRLVDEAAGTVLLPGRDADAAPVVTTGRLVLTPDEPTITTHGYYAAPSFDTVSVLVANLGLVADVPVVDATSDDLAVSTADLGATGQVTYTSTALDVFTQAVNEASTTEIAGDEATVTISSEVLFDPESAELTDAAQAELDRAAAQILSAGQAGQVTVTGHTDDVGTDADNQVLSEQRATAVAERLTPALPDYTITGEGRGEAEPAVDGTSAAARAANRRVEITFTITDPASLTADDSDPGAALPEPTGPVAEGGGTVAYQVRDNSFEVAATVTRHHGYIVGTLTLTNAGTTSARPVEALGGLQTSWGTDRTLSGIAGSHGTQSVTLLTAETRFFPIDYLEPDSDVTGRRTILADWHVNTTLEPGDVTIATVFWPDLGSESVTIDVPDRFRLTDVPVTD